jgi:hypothetical protein
MGNTARVGWVAIAWAASALAGVALGGCASSGEPVGGRQGIIRGQAELSGRVPFAGHSFEVGAISGGKVVKTASVSRSGGSFEFSLPGGTYQLSLLASGIPSSNSGIGCTTNVDSAPGQTVTANLLCTWH